MATRRRSTAGAPPSPSDELERVAPSFGDFLLEMVRDELADQ
jgi:hypothetical protein